MNYLMHPQVPLAAQACHAGEVIAYPTEAVWGLGCDPFHREACERVLQLKSRAAAKGLILVAADPSQLAFLLTDLTAAQHAALAASWPGPNTWLVPHHGRVPAWVTGVHESVAVRVSAHPVVQALCQAFGGPLVSTSANPQSLPPARYGFKARQYFGNNVVYVPGQVNHTARPSTIRDLITGQIIRN